MELAGHGATGGVWRAADELIRYVAVGVVHHELAKDRAARPAHDVMRAAWRTSPRPPGAPVPKP